MGYAARARRISVAKLGGLPCMRSPIRKILAASHTPNHAVAAPIAIEIHTCQNGGGVFDDMRRTGRVIEYRVHCRMRCLFRQAGLLRYKLYQFVHLNFPWN